MIEKRKMHYSDYLNDFWFQLVYIAAEECYVTIFSDFLTLIYDNFNGHVQEP